MKRCSVTSCDKEVRTREYCVTHYHRVLRNGDPHTTKRTLTGTPLEERLTPDKWVHVDRGLGSPCWEWVKHRNQDGYGLIKYNNKSLKLHRVMYERAYGPIPVGKSVLHRCDNPPCSNPGHLFVGTQADNIRDMCSKGRNRSPGPKSDDYIRQVRAMAAGGMKQSEISRLMGTDTSTISRIVNRKLYKRVV